MCKSRVAVLGVLLLTACGGEPRNETAIPMAGSPALETFPCA